MKRIIALLSAITLCVSAFAGCGSGDSSASSQVNDSTSAGASSDATDSDTPSPEELYVSPYDTVQEFRDISAWNLVHEMKTGWVLGNTLDATGNSTLEAEIYWQKDMTTKGLIDYVAESGFDVIRIPVSWGAHMADDYTVDPAWMARVHEVVDYAIDNDMYVVLNTHHEEWYFPTEEDKAQDIEQLTALWEQIAEEFKNYDEHLIFEGLNEPRLRGTANEWNGGTAEARAIVAEYEQAFYNTVRASGGNNDKRMLMLSGYAASASRNCLKAIWIPENDDHIIVSVHAYIPYSLALDANGTTEFTDAGKADIDNFFKTVVELFYVNEIPVIIGEYGAVNKQNDEARIEWAKYFLEYAHRFEIPCLWWDNNSLFGIGENFGLIIREEPYGSRFPELVDAIMSVYDDAE